MTKEEIGKKKANGIHPLLLLLIFAAALLIMCKIEQF